MLSYDAELSIMLVLFMVLMLMLIMVVMQLLVIRLVCVWSSRSIAICSCMPLIAGC